MVEKDEPKGKTTYQYNSAKQLIKMTEPDGRITKYSYDKSGNRSNQTVKDKAGVLEIDYTYNNQNRLTATLEKTENSTVSTKYQYDANGNQTGVLTKDSKTSSTRTDTYVYDELNQLIHISGSDGSTSDYTYYATGLRASKNVNGSTSTFTYDGSKLLVEQTGNTTKTNIYGTNLISTDSTDMLYYQYNNHGDVLSVLDSNNESVVNEKRLLH